MEKINAFKSILYETFDFHKDLYSNGLFNNKLYHNYFGDANNRQEMCRLVEKVFKAKDIYVYYDGKIFMHDSLSFSKKSILMDYLEDHATNSMDSFVISTRNLSEFIYMDTIFEDIFLLSAKSPIIVEEIVNMDTKLADTWIGKISNQQLQKRFLSGMYITKRKLRKLIHIYG
ncbi:hypothetical protein [Enterococcus sp. AD013-P3]|uniref:hypothetical protein n=1 Tax=Enterococcus sp. AD013-P3 TaxID=3411036 RepID=UPI003B9352E7